MKLLKRHWPTLLGAALGALGGYLYWYFVGVRRRHVPDHLLAAQQHAVGSRHGRTAVEHVRTETAPERVKKRAFGRFRTPVFAADDRYRPVTRM